jgi:glutaredoxin
MQRQRTAQLASRRPAVCRFSVLKSATLNNSVGHAGECAKFTLHFMEKPQITAWLKTQCGWSNGVRAVLRKYDLPFEDKDIIQNPAFRWEMEQKSGQSLSPCVEVNGRMLPDISGEELEQFLKSEGLAGQPAGETNVPLNSACTDAQHEAMRAAAGAPLQFKA